MSRLLLAFAAALAACQPQVTADLQLSGPTRVLTDGTSVKLTALATNERGDPGSGSVTFTTTAGTLSASSAALVDGTGSVQLSCSTACPDRVTVSATWNTVTTTHVLIVAAPWDGGYPDAGRSDAGHSDAGATVDGGVDGGRSDAGGVDAGAPDAGAPDAGAADAGDPDAGDPDAGADAGNPDLTQITLSAPWWWLLDGGTYLVPSGEETPSYTCTGWTGQPHPGYTLPDAGPLALGCADEPIDFLFIDSSSPTAIDICGIVTFSTPMAAPVYPRGLLAGRFAVRNLVSSGAWKVQCLRNPNQLTYRFRIEPDAGIYLGMGARTPNYTTSLFGYFDGRTNAPISSPDAAVLLPVQDVSLPYVDFGVGPGRRPGDPP